MSVESYFHIKDHWNPNALAYHYKGVGTKTRYIILNLNRIWEHLSHKSFSSLVKEIDENFLIEFICAKITEEGLWSRKKCKDCPPERCIALINNHPDPVIRLRDKNLFITIFKEIRFAAYYRVPLILLISACFHLIDLISVSALLFILLCSAFIYCYLFTIWCCIVDLFDKNASKKKTKKFLWVIIPFVYLFYYKNYLHR